MYVVCTDVGVCVWCVCFVCSWIEDREYFLCDVFGIVCALFICRRQTVHCDASQVSIYTI